MRTRTIAAAICASLCCTVALAGPKEDAYQTVEKWAAAFNSSDVEKVVALYSEDALVLGTLSPTLASKPDDLRHYFARSAAAKSHVTLGESAASVLSPDAVAFEGFYEFSRPGKDGAAPAVNPARYSFVVVKRGSEWKIVQHHSSPRPKPAH